MSIVIQPSLYVRWFYLVGSLAITICILGLSFWFWSGTGAKGPKADAETAYENGDWANATRLANERLRLEKNDIPALRILARSMARQGKDDLATAIYENRVTLDRMETEDRFLLGQIIARQGNADLALGVWGKAIAADPNHGEMIEAEATLLARKFRFEEAAKSALTLASLPGFEARGSLLTGIFRASMDDTAGSVSAFRKAFEIDPAVKTDFMPSDRTAKLFARNLMRSDDASEASRILQLHFGPDFSKDSEAAWLMARAELRLGQKNPDQKLLKHAHEYLDSNPLELEPSPFVGEARCAKCHADISRDYAATRHASSFRHGPALLNLELPEKPLPDPDDTSVTHTFEKKEDHVEIVTRKGDQELIRVLAEFAFGTTDRYVTMVGQDHDGNFRAARLSHYLGASGSGWDRTSGDTGDGMTDTDVHGQKIHAREGVVRCLACHVTAPRDFRKGATDRSAAFADKGLGCESCHGPGSNHLIAASTESSDMAIRSLIGIDGHGINRVCVDCHTVGDPNEIRASPEDPKWVRSAGVTFPLSRCFTESNGNLSCITCHDPHRRDKPEGAYFESKCTQCHTGKATNPVSDASKAFRTETVCSTGARNECIKCHMPKIPVPVLHDSLTDHYIRVRK